MMNIAGSEEHYLDAEGAGDIAEKFNYISQEIKKSVPNGEVSDPIGEYFNLDLKDIENPENIKVKYPWTKITEPEYTDYDIEITMDSSSIQQENERLNRNYSELIAEYSSNPDLTPEQAEEMAAEEAKNRRLRVVYSHEDEKLKIINMNLMGEGNWVNMRYRIQADTEIKDENGNEIFEPGILYPANGKTTLIPDIYSEKKEVLNFYVPSARAGSVDIEVIKEWSGFSDEAKFDVEFDLKRNGETYNRTKEPYVIRKNSETGEWELKIENLIKFDSRGQDYTFEVSERRDSAANYFTEVEDITNEFLNPGIKKFKIKNILPSMPNTGGKGNINYKLAGYPLFIGAAGVLLVKLWKH